MIDSGFKLCTMYQKKSLAGNMYFFGRMGNTKLTLLLDKRNQVEGKDPVWNLLIAEADQSAQAGEPSNAAWGPSRVFSSADLPAAGVTPSRPEDRRHWTPEQRAAKHDEIIGSRLPSAQTDKRNTQTEEAMRASVFSEPSRRRAPRRPKTAKKGDISAYDAQAPFIDDSAVFERMTKGEI